MKIIKINGVEVDLDRIQNPKLEGIVRERDFMFSYVDKHSDSDHRDWYTDKHHEYKERAGHRDHTESPPKYDDWFVCSSSVPQ